MLNSYFAKMHYTSYLLALAFVIGIASEATALDVTNSTQDYYLTSQRKLQKDIADANKRINVVKERGNDHIQVYEEQKRVLLDEMQRVHERFVALETVSQNHKHCVQKYKTRLVSVYTAESRISTCISNAQKRVDTLTQQTVNPMTNANNNANKLLDSSIYNCNIQYFNDTTKLENCVIKNVDTYSAQTNRELNSVDKVLDASLCSIKDLNTETIRCTFQWENSVLVTIGNVNTLIDVCVSESEKPPCCPCSNATSPTGITEVHVNGTAIKSIIMGPVS